MLVILHAKAVPLGVQKELDHQPQQIKDYSWAQPRKH